MSEPRPRQPGAKPKSIMRSLGEFFGHIAQGVRTDPGAKAPTHPPPAPTRRVVSTTTHEEPGPPGPDGSRVILRRTTIEEVEVRPPTGRHTGA